MKKGLQIKKQTDLKVNLEYQALSMNIPCYSTAFKHRAILPPANVLVKYLYSFSTLVTPPPFLCFVGGA